MTALDDRPLRDECDALHKFAVALRRDCKRLGLDPDLVDRCDVRTLLDRKRHELRRLMTEPPGGFKCPD